MEIHWLNFANSLDNIGDLNFFLIIFIPLAILFFFLLTKPYATYFNEISTGINRLADGDFQNRVHISSNDEFKDIAEDINLASEKLQEGGRTRGFCRKQQGSAGFEFGS